MDGVVQAAKPVEQKSLILIHFAVWSKLKSCLFVQFHLTHLQHQGAVRHQCLANPRNHIFLGGRYGTPNVSGGPMTGQ